MSPEDALRPRRPVSPATPLTPVFDRLLDADDEVAEPVVEVATAYGPLPVLEPSDGRPVLIANFAASLDGKISFGPAHPSPRHLTLGTLHDRWLMGLLRARVDAVLIGARTLWDDPAHVWTAAAICAEDAALLDRVRLVEGRHEPPWCVVATRSGELPPDARVLAGTEQPVLVVTTDAGAARIADAPWRDHAEVLALGDNVTPQELLDALGRRGCTRVLSEAGPGLYVPLLEAGIGHELYLTLCPVLVGGDGHGALSLAHGAGFRPDTAPRPAIRSVRSGAGQVYLRVRVRDA